MNLALLKRIIGVVALTAALAGWSVAQDNPPMQGNAGQASQPGPGVNVTAPSAQNPGAVPVTSTANPSPMTNGRSSYANSTTSTRPGNKTTSTNGDANPYDPVLEPPPMPRGKPTLIGGTATHVDHVRNRLTVAPFGGSPKLKLLIDERTHIYRDGTPTTVLGIHQGDRVYADTVLDGSKIFAENVRVITEPGIAEVRGQVVGRDPARGTISVRDQLSSRLVSFSVSGATKYSGKKGEATAGDVQVGSLVDVQFSPVKSNRDIAQEITVLAKPGDDYLFSGVITHLDMRTDTVSINNSSDQQNYDLHFQPSQLADARDLKVGAEVTARAVFDGKEYKTSNIRIEKSTAETEEH